MRCVVAVQRRLRAHGSMRVEEGGRLCRTRTAGWTVRGIIVCGGIGRTAATAVVVVIAATAAGVVGGCSMTIVGRMLLLSIQPILMRERMSAHTRRPTKTGGRDQDIRPRTFELATVVLHSTFGEML